MLEIKGFDSPSRLSIHSSNSSKVGGSEKGSTEETLSIHSDRSGVVVNERAITDNVRCRMLGFVNSQKHKAGYPQLIDDRDKAAKDAKASTEKVRVFAEQVDKEYVDFLKANSYRRVIISDGLQAGFDSRKMLVPMVVKLKEKSDQIKENIAESLKISSDDLAYRTRKIPELTNQLEMEKEEQARVRDKLNSSKFDEVNNREIKGKLSELEEAKDGFELPQPPRWVHFFGKWAVKLYASCQNWAWERHGVGKQYREVTAELDRLNGLCKEFAELNKKDSILKHSISDAREELEEAKDGYELLQSKTKTLGHLLNNVVNVYFTKSIYSAFSKELEAAKTVKTAPVVKKTTVKDSKVDLRKSSVSTAASSSEDDLRSSVIFDNISTSNSKIDIYTEDFSKQMKTYGPSKLEGMVEESAIMRQSAAVISNAFSEVQRILSTPYAKYAVSSKESALINTAEYQARSYQGFLNSVYNFAERVTSPSEELFKNNKIMEKSTSQLTEVNAELSKFKDIDIAYQLVINEGDAANYLKLYRAMTPEARKEYMQSRYIAELKEYHGLTVAQFIDIVSKDLTLNKAEISEFEAFLKSEDKPVEILSSSSFIDELQSA